jgi:hypothetical protein
MTCFANGIATKLYYCMEDGSGSLPGTPAWLPIRFVSENIARNTAQILSNEIRADRQREVARQGTYSTQGTIAGELSIASHDDLIEAALQGTWAAVATKTASTISAAASDNSFNDSGNGFVTAGFAVGQTINVSGFTGAGVVVNNSSFVITAVTAGKITIGGTDGDVIVDDAAGESVTIVSKSDKLTIGSTRRTFSVLERHTDKSLDYIYRGCEVTTMDVNAALNARFAITFGIIGKAAETYTVGSDTFTAAGSTDPFVTTDAAITEGGSALGIATDLSLKLDNGMTPAFAVGTRQAYCVGNGIATVSGQLSAYLTDGTLYDKHLDETDTSVSITGTDGSNSIKFDLGKVIYTNATKGVSGPGAIIPQYTYSAGLDTSSQTLTVTRTSP